jgi:hypothetical protein
MRQFHASPANPGMIGLAQPDFRARIDGEAGLRDDRAVYAHVPGQDQRAGALA